MAKQYGSYMGGFSGKLGPAVGYSWNGIWVLRSLPQQVANPRTEAQMARRDIFKREVQLAASMQRGVKHGLTAMAREAHMTAYNLFVSINQPCFGIDEGRFSVDWQRLQISMGPVAPVQFGQPELDDGNVLTVSFEKHPHVPRADSHDFVFVYVYDPASGHGFLTAPVHRYSGRLGVVLPDLFDGHEVHLYGFAQDEDGAASATSYLGTLTLTGSTLQNEEPQVVAEEPAVAPATVPVSTAAKPAAPTVVQGTLFPTPPE